MVGKITGSTVVHARKVMLENNINRILVTDDEHLVGILTGRDISKGLREFRRALDKYKHADIHGIKVDDVMNREPVTVTKFMSVAEAVKIMLENNISGIPVVGGKLGIITKTGLVKGIADGNLP